MILYYSYSNPLLHCVRSLRAIFVLFVSVFPRQVILPIGQNGLGKRDTLHLLLVFHLDSGSCCKTVNQDQTMKENRLPTLLPSAWFLCLRC